MNILKDLFDEKVIEIIDLFLENPEKKYSLTDISNTTKINIATTFRIVKKLVEKEFVTPVKIKKVNIYKLAENEKTKALSKLLKKESEPLQKFTKELSKYSRVKKIILDSKEDHTLKILIVGDSVPKEKINNLCREIKKEFETEINFVELSEAQYKALKDFKNYNLEKKVIWQREEN